MSYLNQSRYFLIATLIFVIGILALESTQLNLMLNLQLQDQLDKLTNAKSNQHSVIIQTKDNTRETITMVSPYARKLYWVLGDVPLTNEQKNLIQRFNIQTIKIPAIKYDNSGELSLDEKTNWQPDAGYLLPIPKLFGLNREFVESTVTKAKTFRSPTSYYSLELNNHFIDFNTVPISTAIFEEDQIQDMSSIVDILQDKRIFLTSHLELEGFNIVPPNNEGKIGWHIIQYHAAALYSAEQGFYFQPLAIDIKLLIFVGIGILLFIAFINISSKRYFYVLFTVNFILITLVPLGQLWLNILPSFTEMFVCLFIFNYGMLRQKHALMESTLTQLNSQIFKSIRPTLLGQQLNVDFWQDITNLVTQSLNLNKSIFLQKVPDDHRLKEISAFNCQLNDIHEMRRDYEREPYLSAIKKRRCIPPTRKYFTQLEPEEIELIVPFIKNDNVLGFWALTVVLKEGLDYDKLIRTIELFASKIGDLLYREKFVKNTKPNPLKQLFLKKNATISEIELRNSVSSLLESQAFFRRIFYTMNNAAIVFDLFGHVLEVNTSMEKLAQRYQLQLFDKNAFYFLKQFMNESEDSIRFIFRQLTLNENVEQHSTIVNLGDSAYILTLTAIVNDNENKVENDMTASGLMCEFFDIRELINHQTIERGLYDNYLVKIKNYLSAVQLGILQMESRLDDPELTYLHHLIQNKLSQSAKLTVGTHYFLNEVQKRKSDTNIPFSPQQVINEEAEQIKRYYKQNQSDISVTTSFENHSLCIGQAQRFRQLISALLKLLADDSVEPKLISVESKYITKKHGSYIYIKITNKGYGVSKSILEQLKQNEVQDLNSLLGSCLYYMEFFNRENNYCRLKTSAGKGFRISFVLEGIELDE